MHPRSLLGWACSMACVLQRCVNSPFQQCCLPIADVRIWGGVLCNGASFPVPSLSMGGLVAFVHSSNGVILKSTEHFPSLYIEDKWTPPVGSHRNTPLPL